MQYREINNTNPLMFIGDKEPIIALIWISDMEVCYYTCLCPKDHKLNFALNLLHCGAKD